MKSGRQPYYVCLAETSARTVLAYPVGIHIFEECPAGADLRPLKREHVEDQRIQRLGRSCVVRRYIDGCNARGSAKTCSIPARTYVRARNPRLARHCCDI
jgi:hypothetical protein